MPLVYPPDAYTLIYVKNRAIGIIYLLPRKWTAMGFFVLGSNGPVCGHATGATVLELNVLIGSCLERLLLTLRTPIGPIPSNFRILRVLKRVPRAISTGLVPYSCVKRAIVISTVLRGCVRVTIVVTYVIESYSYYVKITYLCNVVMELGDVEVAIDPISKNGFISKSVSGHLISVHFTGLILKLI